MVRPSALAVLRLMISENFVGCCTGRSVGLAPLRMRSMSGVELQLYCVLRREIENGPQRGLMRSAWPGSAD